MDEKDRLKLEVDRLSREIEYLRIQQLEQNQSMAKKRAEIAGPITDIGIFEEEIKKIGLETGFDKEEVKVISYFSVNGRMLDKEKVSRCYLCNLILTDAEKIEIKNRIYCEKCLREKEHDLDKDDFKILLCLFNGITSFSFLMENLGFSVTMMRVTGLVKTEIESRIEKLFNNGYLYLHGLIFKSIRVTSKGEEGLVAYNQIFHDQDINIVKERISNIRVGI